MYLVICISAFVTVSLGLWYFYRIPPAHDIVRLVKSGSSRTVDIEIKSLWKRLHRLEICGIKGEKTVAQALPVIQVCDKQQCQFDQLQKWFALPRNPGIVTSIPPLMYAQSGSGQYVYAITPIFASVDGIVQFVPQRFFELIRRDARVATISIGQFEEPVPVAAIHGCNFLTFQVQSGNAVVKGDILMMTATRQHRTAMPSPCLDCEGFFRINVDSDEGSTAVWIPSRIFISSGGKTKQFRIKPICAPIDGVASLRIPDGQRPFWFFDFVVTGEKLFTIEPGEFAEMQTVQAEAACNIVSFIAQTKTRVKTGDAVMLVAVDY